MKKNLLVAFFALLLFTMRLSAQTVFTDTTAGSGSWVCPAGVTSVTVECWGGGGGGGFAHYEYSASGSGAGGSYISYTMAVTPGKTYYFVVGAGGSGGTDSITPGGTGGASYFGSTIDTTQANAVVLAIGGLGGNSTDTGGKSAAHDSATGGAAVTSGNLPLTGYTTSLYGAAGGSSTSTGATAGGAGAHGGAGGAASTNYAASKIGYNGVVPGGGGSGAIDKTVKAGEVGGKGATGEVQITYVSATSVFKPASFTATDASATQINLSVVSNANNNNIVVVFSKSNSFLPPTNGVAAGASGTSFLGGTVVYTGAANGLTSQTGLIPGTTYYYEALCYDASNNYSPVIAASATTLISNIVNTDFTGTTPNYFSGIATQAATVTQSWGSGVLNEKYVVDSGYALGTNSDTDYTLMPIDTAFDPGSSYTLGYAVSSGWYEDYLIAPVTGYALDVSSISGIFEQSAAAATNTFGVLYGIGTATTPPDTFYNAISTTQNVDTGAGTKMAATTEKFSSTTAGITLNGVSNLSGSQVLYVRLVFYRAYATTTKAILYNAGLTVGGTFSNDLPISLAKFDATKINATTAAVNWSVATANDIKEFEVTKSTDGTNFKSIGSVVFAGTKTYSFNDNNLGAGTSYYRLASIDKDGAEQYSNVATVVNKTSRILILSLAPNLVHSTTYLNVSASSAGNLTARVIDLLGRTVQEKTIGVAVGNSQINFDFSSLKVGSYLLQTISSDGTVKTIRFEKQ
jgi:hypothetical protein